MNGAIDRSDVLRLGPRTVERPADAGSTLVAGIDGHGPALVDGAGLVSPVGPRGGRWSIDWWVGADDRWHLPAREPAIRQRRIGHGPIIETSLRVPSGDVVHTVYPVVVAGRTITVIEIRNDSPVPVALALAIRPYSVDGSQGSGADGGRRLELLDGGVVAVDGLPTIRLPRPPNEAGALVDGDLLEAVEAGRPLSWSGPVGGPAANAVCLYPLPHKTSLRFAVESTGGGPGIDLGALPDSESAARGWTAVVERASRFEFPDSGITALAGAARARLMLAAPDLPAAVVDAAPGAGRVLEGLALGGHRFECRPSVEAFARSFPTRLPSTPLDAAAVINGVGLAAQLLGDERLNQELLEPSAQLTRLVERAGGRRANVEAARLARIGLARLVDLVGQHDSAAQLRADWTGAPTTGLDELTAVAEQAAPARRWSEPGTTDTAPADDGRSTDRADLAAGFWISARGLLLRERPSAEHGSTVIELLPEFPTAWLGGAVEVHRAPIAGCRISFAIRWHGYRPALLWEVEGEDSGPSEDIPPSVITCPGLDPTWRTDQPQGEALLAGSADALPDSPQPGDSFQ